MRLRQPQLLRVLVVLVFVTSLLPLSAVAQDQKTGQAGVKKRPQSSTWRLHFVNGDVVNLLGFKFRELGLEFRMGIAPVQSASVSLDKIGFLERATLKDSDREQAESRSLPQSKRSKSKFVVRLRSGERCFGEIVSLDAAKLELRSESLGLIEIPRQRIFALTSVTDSRRLQREPFIGDVDKIESNSADLFFGEVSASATHLHVRRPDMKVELGLRSVREITFACEDLKQWRPKAAVGNDSKTKAAGLRCLAEFRDGSQLLLRLKMGVTSNASELKNSGKNSLLMTCENGLKVGSLGFAAIQSLRFLSQFPVRREKTVLLWSAFRESDGERDRVKEILSDNETGLFVQESESLIGDIDFESKVKLASTVVIVEPKKRLSQRKLIVECLQSTLRDFVLAGGRLLVLAPGREFLELLREVNFIDAEIQNNISHRACFFARDAQIFAFEIGNEIQAANESVGFRVSNADRRELVIFRKQALVVERRLGRGRIILHGSDYFRSDTDTDQLLLNLIRVDR